MTPILVSVMMQVWVCGHEVIDSRRKLVFGVDEKRPCTDSDVMSVDERKPVNEERRYQVSAANLVLSSH